MQTHRYTTLCLTCIVYFTQKYVYLKFFTITNLFKILQPINANIFNVGNRFLFYCDEYFRLKFDENLINPSQICFSYVAQINKQKRMNYKEARDRVPKCFLTWLCISCRQNTRGKSFRNCRETIGITSNTVDTPVTASRKQLIQQVIHLEIRRNTGGEEFEGSRGGCRKGCYQLWINRAKFPGSVLTELSHENAQVYSSRTHRQRNTADVDLHND